MLFRSATAAGNKFVDFTVEGDSVQKLSDYVGRGRYTLVDFWASWCGPCRREMPVIKELYDEFNSKGLDVVGVAVWDEPEDSKKAMEQLELPWPQILNAKSVPTDLYGSSKRCLMPRSVGASGKEAIPPDSKVTPFISIYASLPSQSLTLKSIRELP